MPEVNELFAPLPEHVRTHVLRWMSRRPPAELRRVLAAIHQFITMQVLFSVDEEEYTANRDLRVAAGANLLSLVHGANELLIKQERRKRGSISDEYADDDKRERIVLELPAAGSDNALGSSTAETIDENSPLKPEEFINETLSDHIHPTMDMVKFHGLHTNSREAVVSYARLAPFAMTTQTKATFFEMENRIRHVLGRQMTLVCD